MVILVFFKESLNLSLYQFVLNHLHPKKKKRKKNEKSPISSANIYSRIRVQVQKQYKQILDAQPPLQYTSMRPFLRLDSSHLGSILQGSSIAYFSVETICESIILQAESFRSVGFSYVKRKGNKPAHILAEVAKQIGDFNLQFGWRKLLALLSTRAHWM